MTEKEKAKAYDEALKKASAAHKDEDRHLKATLERIFPELKEDDTERIRKNCIHFLELQKQHHAATFEIEECIDWLEKQGKKSTDKIEPRFKVGDWVVFITSGSAYQVEKKENYEYTLRNIHGGLLCVSFSNEELIREWTIQDAVDGDVIFYDEGWICIFKCIHGIWYSSYCFITDDGEFHTGYERHAVDSTIHGNAHPATKEQRDLLLQKIKEAGYGWDAEKKELKKLVEPKFKVGDKIVNISMKYWGAPVTQGTISKITEDKYIFTDGSYMSISSQDSWELVSDKKPKFDPETIKTYNDINIGDTVYIWGTSDSSVDETTITEKYDDRDHWNLKFSNGCVGRALKNGTSSTMGMYACLVYSDKEAVRESINEQIKILSNIKI